MKLGLGVVMVLVLIGAVPVSAGELVVYNLSNRAITCSMDATRRLAAPMPIFRSGSSPDRDSMCLPVCGLKIVRCSMRRYRLTRESGSRRW